MEVPRLQLFLRPVRFKSVFYLSMMNYGVLWGRESEGWRHELQSHFSHLSWSTHITKEFTWQTCINILWKIHISAHTSGEKPEKVWFYIYNYLAKLQRNDKPTVSPTTLSSPRDLPSTIGLMWREECGCCLVAQSCPTPGYPMDCKG